MVIGLPLVKRISELTKPTCTESGLRGLSNNEAYELRLKNMPKNVTSNRIKIVLFNCINPDVCHTARFEQLQFKLYFFFSQIIKLAGIPPLNQKHKIAQKHHPYRFDDE